MDLEARSLQPGVKAMLLAKLREYKADLGKLKKELKRFTSPNANQAAREELLESGMADTHLVDLDNSIFTVTFKFKHRYYLLSNTPVMSWVLSLKSNFGNILIQLK